MTLRIHDPFLPWIWGYAIAGLTCTAMSLPGYLHQTEKISLGIATIEMPAPLRKIPFALAGASLMVLAWNETQNRRYWLEDAEAERQHHLLLRKVGNQAELQAQAQALQYLAQMQAAQQVYGQLEPYLPNEQPRTIDVPHQAQPPQQTQQLPPAQPPQQPVTPAYSPAQQPPVQAWAPASPAQQVGGDRPVYAPVTPVSQPAPVQDSVPGIPIRDLSPEIARYRGHVLIASRTRSGKTTTIQAAIHQAHALYQGQAKFFIFDPKGASWCGLEQSQNYLFCNKPEDIPQVLMRLEGLILTMQARQQARVQSGGHYAAGSEPQPIFIAIDEFNTLLSLAQEYDESFPVKENPRTQSKIQRYVERIIFQGAEDLVFLWLMAQTTRVKQLGLNTSVQDNMAYFAQARNGDWQSVEDAITNNYVVSNALERKRLWELLNTYRADTSQNLSIPLCFTTLGGNQLCKLPDLSQAKHNRVTPSGPSPQETQEPTAPPQQRDRPNRPIPKSDRSSFLSQARSWLEECWEAEEEEPTVPELQPRDIPAHLKALVGYCEGRGWVKAAEIQRNVRAYDGLSTDAIRSLFHQAVGIGIGSVQGQGNQLAYRVDSL